MYSPRSFETPPGGTYFGAADMRGLNFPASAFAADDFIAAKDIDDDWTQPADPRSGRNLAVGYGRAGMDYAGRGWSVGVFTRGDGFGKTNRDSIVVFQQPGIPCNCSIPIIATTWITSSPASARMGCALRSRSRPRRCPVRWP